jgi:hypothetical protein
MLNNIKLNAGAYTELAITGRFINIVLAAGEIQARMRLKNGSTFQTKLVSGMSFELPEGFVSAAFLSETAQQTKIWLSNLPLTYSPLEAKMVGSNAIKSSHSKVGYGAPQLLASATAGRGKITVSGKEDFFIGGEGVNALSAVLVPAYTPVTLNTQGAIYGYTDQPEKAVMKTATADSVEDFKFQTLIPYAGFTVIFYSDLTGSYYTISGGGIQERSVVDYTVIKTYPISENGDVVDTDNSACPSYIEHGGLFYIVIAANSGMHLITFDPVEQVIKETKLTAASGKVIDYKLDVERNKLTMLIDFDGVDKLFDGSLDAISEKAVPEISIYGLRAILVMGDNEYILYGYDFYAKSIDSGVTWAAKQPMAFNFSYWGGVTLDKTTGYVIASSQFSAFRSVDGENWTEVYAFSGNKYQWFVGGGQVYAVGELNMIFSNDGGNTWGSLSLSPWYTGANNATNDVFPTASGQLFIINNSEGTLRFGGDVSVSGGINVALLEEIN